MQPKSNCQVLHEWARSKERYRFPFERATIPTDGIYLLFEKGESGHGTERIVRVGTHTGKGQLPSRLVQHFAVENKDRSIFRKNIGRALLNKAGDAYLAVWELDMTPAAARALHGAKVDTLKQQEIEREVTAYMQKNFSFVFVPVEHKDKRLAIESKIISTLSLCEECRPSPGWLGHHSPKQKIRESGLWLVNELYKTPLSEVDLIYLQHI